MNSITDFLLFRNRLFQRLIFLDDVRGQFLKLIAEQEQEDDHEHGQGDVVVDGENRLLEPVRQANGARVEGVISPLLRKMIDTHWFFVL